MRTEPVELIIKTATEPDLVVKDIKAIGTVTLKSGDSITVARNAYDALADKQKKMVSNYDKLVEAEEKYRILVAADNVTQRIKSIGEVTLDSKAAIENAREAYDALPDAGKKYVSGYDTLVTAEKTLAVMEVRNTVIEAVNKTAEKACAKVDNIGKKDIENIRAQVEKEINTIDNTSQISQVGTKAIQEIEGNSGNSREQVSKRTGRCQECCTRGTGAVSQ